MIGLFRTEKSIMRSIMPGNTLLVVARHLG